MINRKACDIKVVILIRPTIFRQLRFCLLIFLVCFMYLLCLPGPYNLTENRQIS